MTMKMAANAATLSPILDQKLAHGSPRQPLIMAMAASTANTAIMASVRQVDHAGEEIRLAERQAIVPQDVVRRGDVEIEIRQRHAGEIVDARLAHLDLGAEIV